MSEEVTGEAALEVAELGQPSQRLTVTDTPTPDDPGLSGWPVLDGAALGQPGQALTVTDTSPPEGPAVVECSTGEVELAWVSGVAGGCATVMMNVVGTG